MKAPIQVFEGKRTPAGALVLADGQLLSTRPSLSLRNHSPTGFEWGYGGSGPAQLALALLLAAGIERGEALTLYQEFKRDVVARLPAREWRLPAVEVRSWWAVRVGALIPPEEIP